MIFGLILRFLLLFLAFLSAQSIRTTAVFVVSWLAGHCQYIQGRCDPNVIKRWDHKSFTINGLWPSEKGKYQKYGKFNLTLLKTAPQLYNQMNLYWPPQPQKGGKPYFLWQLKWKDHVSAFGDIIFQLQHDNFTRSNVQQRKQIQLAYFQTSISLYRGLNLKNMSTSYINKAQMAARMNISQNSFYFICTQAGTLRQIRVCIDFNQRGSKIFFECNRRDQYCKSTIILKDWVNKSSRNDQLQRKRISDAQAAQIAEAWKADEASSKGKVITDQEQAEIQFYQKQLSQEQLDIDGFLNNIDYTVAQAVLLLTVLLVCYCLEYLRKQSESLKARNKNLAQIQHQIQLTQGDSKKNKQPLFQEP